MALARREAEALDILEKYGASIRTVGKMRIYAALGQADEAARQAEIFVRDQPEFARQNIDVPQHPAYEAFLADPRYRKARLSLGLPPL